MPEDRKRRGDKVPPPFLNMADLVFRPIEPKDDAFLYALYAETRTDLEALDGLSPHQKDLLLRQQFEFQHRDYKSNYPEANFEIVLLAGRPIGRLYVNRGKDRFKLIEITVCLELRGHGIGALLLKKLHVEATTANKPVLLQVARFNPAVNLYLRHGFRVVDDSGVYLRMECSPGC